ncbi:S-layer homology domain-containing protein [Egicoccus sp. AB-alg6-2]|uniref:S-layer homology domain-containing protein n=1 Tax=Egicoccus sp. AB-alg6-2 TaxID=3242692 RepID=UPI00359E77F9
MGLLVAAAPAALAQPDGFPRNLDRACDRGAQQAAPFVDVDPASDVGAAVGCLWVHDVVAGRFVGDELRFDADAPLTRQQMASFLGNALHVLPAASYAAPAVTTPDFVDAATISGAHRVAVARLQADGIVAGYGDRTFRPGRTLDRAQMASFVAAAVEAVLAEPLARDAAFDDVAGTHAANIEKLAAAGIADTSSATFAPHRSATRGEMAQYMARALDLLAERGHLQAISYAPHSPDAWLGLREVTATEHPGFDRLSFVIDGGAGTPGWRVRYVDAAIEHGRGHELAVRGEAILQVHLTGMALPPELAFADWDAGRLAVDGAGIVEVVDAGVYEGRRLLFVGTTGRHAVTVSRADPGRIHLDVAGR